MSVTAAPSAHVFCTQCGRMFPVDDVMLFGQSYVCADCKPSFLQRVREGSLPAQAMNYASVWGRFLALILDGIVLFIANITVQFIVGGGLILPTPGAAGAVSALFNLATLVNLVVGFLYYTLLLTNYGATLGKMALGMKVVTAEGGPISFGRATGRYFCASFLEALTLGIGDIIAFFDSQKRALHDRICGTRVIKIR